MMLILFRCFVAVDDVNNDNDDVDLFFPVLKYDNSKTDLIIIELH